MLYVIIFKTNCYYVIFSRLRLSVCVFGGGVTYMYTVFINKMISGIGNCCLRPYHIENTSSRPITEVKQRRARLVLGWVTAWEYRVL